MGPEAPLKRRPEPPPSVRRKRFAALRDSLPHLPKAIAALLVIAGVLLLLAVVAGTLWNTSSTGREDTCIDVGGIWIDDIEECLDDDDFSEYRRCRRLGRDWGFRERRCTNDRILPP